MSDSQGTVSEACACFRITWRLPLRSFRLSDFSESASSASEKSIAWLGARRFHFILQHLGENYRFVQHLEPGELFTETCGLLDILNTTSPNRLSAHIRLYDQLPQHRTIFLALRLLFEQAFVPSILHFSVTTFPLASLHRLRIIRRQGYAYCTNISHL